jgi:aryl-alcohol dehydrogenase-like predicted oxidoreductase
MDQLSPDDFRANNPRFLKGNFEQNMRIVQAVETVATEVAATPAQVALAWLLAQGDDIVPIPGTKHVFRMEENAAAIDVTLTPEQVARLSAIQAPVGERYADMSRINR